VWGANIVVKITPPTAAEATLLEDRTILSFIQVRRKVERHRVKEWGGEGRKEDRTILIFTH
jgi:hypothetical protein